MSTFANVLFPIESNKVWNDKLLLVSRIVFGLLFLRHGISKWIHYDTLVSTLPNPLGMGSEATLIIIIIIEVFCSCALIIGFLSRFALIPMIFDMFIVVTVVLSKTPFEVKELPLLYLIIFILLLFSGPGKYSFDSLIGRSILRNRRKRGIYNR